MSEKYIVNESEDIQGNHELESLETEANAGLLPPSDFVFEVNGDVYNDERISENYATSDNGRGYWGRELDFIISCIGFAVGLGNIWRFPYLCYKNGGGAFLIPYAICLITCGLPIFLLELGLGQYMNTGFLGAWRIVPGLQGIGAASFVATFLMNIYYIIVLAWTFNYLILSFTSQLPWATCGNEWNTDRCFDQTRNACILTNVTNSSICGNATVAAGQTVDAVVEFWERRILHISDGIDNPGGLVGQLTLSLFIVWFLVYLCIWRGIGWMGKIAYFTALFPYVMLFSLLIRGVTLDGAAEGIKFYLKPDFTRLSSPQVWIDGGTQIFFSYAIAIGVMISLGSYNKFNNNFYKDCLIIASVNSGTSLVGGFAVFSVLGFMAAQQNTTVADVAESGPGLIFVAYPKAVTQMPLPPLWSVLFFFMVLLLGLNSQFVGVQGILTVIYDRYPKHLYKTKNKMIVGGVYCGLSFLIGLSMVTKGGMYVFQIFDYYSCSGIVLLWILFFESLAVGWIFGVERFYDAIELMIGQRIPIWFKLCWKILTPLVTMGILLFMTIKFTPLVYNKTYIYPPAYQALGLCLAIISMVCIPIVFIWKVIKAPGNLKQKFRHISTPILSKGQIVPSWKELGFKWRAYGVDT